VIALERNDKDYGYSFFPNPVQNEVFYQFSAETDEKIKIEIVDVLGRIISTKILTANPGVNTLRTDMSSLIPGSYLIRATHVNSGMLHSAKIVKK
jgi:hypothetical protein